MAIDRVSAAFEAMPRALFLPTGQRRYAAQDRPLPIGHGQTNSQPTTVRNMLDALDARPGHRVLDIGSGSGWTTALLAHLVGPLGSVLGVERVAALVERGRSRLAELGLTWAQVRAVEPGVLGAPGEGPFDRILVSAMADRVPDALLDDLGADGVLVVPAGGVLWRVTHAERVSLGRYLFVPLILDPTPHPDFLRSGDTPAPPNAL